MKGKKKIIIIVVVAVVLVLAAAGTAAFFLLPKDKGDEEAEKFKVDFPATYQLNDIVIPALQVVQQEPADSEEAAETEEKEESGEEAPKDAEEQQEGSEEEKPAEEDPNRPTWKQESISATYVYHNFPDLLESITQYVAKMTGGQGYFAVDENMQKKKAVAAEGNEGSCSLAKTGDEEGTIIHLDIAWMGEDCTVVASSIPGEIKEAIETYESSGNSAGKKTLSLLEAKEFIWSLSPSALGLEGDNMRAYQIYTADVDAMVDGQPCIRLSIFKKEETGANVSAGEYCLTRTGDKLYRIQKGSNKVTQVELPISAIAG